MRRLTTSLLAISVSFSLHAEAQPSSQPPAVTAKQKAVLPRLLADAMTKKARDLYTEGTEAMAKGHVAEARAAFVAAWALEQHYSIACNLGDAESRLGRHRDAAERLALCVREIDKDAKATDAERTAVKKLFEDAKPKIVEVVIRAPERAEPPPVAVFVDGAAAGQTPPDATAFLDPGKHVVTLVAAGYEDEQVEIDGTAGARKEIRPALRKKVEVVPTSTSTATLPPPPPPSKLPAFIAGGAGVLGLVVGGVLLGSSYAAQADVNRDMPKDADGNPRCPRSPAPASDVPGCAELRSRTSEANALGNAGVVSLAVGGTAVVAGAVYFLWASTRGSAAQPAGRIVPVAGPHGGGLVLQGSF